MHNLETCRLDDHCIVSKLNATCMPIRSFPRPQDAFIFFDRMIAASWLMQAMSLSSRCIIAVISNLLRCMGKLRSLSAKAHLICISVETQNAAISHSSQRPRWLGTRSGNRSSPAGRLPAQQVSSVSDAVHSLQRLPGSVLRSSLGSGRIPLPQVPRRQIDCSG